MSKKEKNCTLMSYFNKINFDHYFRRYRDANPDDPPSELEILSVGIQC